MKTATTLLLAGLLGASASCFAKNGIDVDMVQINQQGVADRIGTVHVQSHEHGVLFTPDLRGLEPGLHGFHVHQNADCGTGHSNGRPVPGGAAGGHYDPANTGKHLGPYEAGGHQGDLPTLYVDSDGRASQPVLAPRLELDDISGKALMIHSGGDNYSDTPKPLGGGGARVACGVIES